MAAPYSVSVSATDVVPCHWLMILLVQTEFKDPYGARAYHVYACKIQA
jgi:hypothetical protein